jgi:CBS domain-containing protein
MQTIGRILQRKGQAAWTVSPDTMVYDALKLMAEKDVGALLVLDGGQLVGIISERDYARKVILREKSSLKTPVRAIMSDRVVCVQPAQSIAECMTLMTEKRVRHLPVLVEDEVVGIVSIGDLLKAALEEKDALIRELEGHIETLRGDRRSRPLPLGN